MVWPGQAAASAVEGQARVVKARWGVWVTDRIAAVRRRADGCLTIQPATRPSTRTSNNLRQPPEVDGDVLAMVPERNLGALDIAQLVRRAAKGDRWAWERLVEQYGRLIWAMTRDFKLTESDAADVFQVTWLRQHIDRLEQPARVGSWLAATARNECLRAREALSRLPRQWQRLVEMLMADPPTSYAEISDQLDDLFQEIWPLVAEMAVYPPPAVLVLAASRAPLPGRGTDSGLSSGNSPGVIFRAHSCLSGRDHGPAILDSPASAGSRPGTEPEKHIQGRRRSGCRRGGGSRADGCHCLSGFGRRAGHGRGTGRGGAGGC
jgi:hypothetical protein